MTQHLGKDQYPSIVIYADLLPFPQLLPKQDPPFTPVTPWPYTDVRDSPIAAPSPSMEMSSPSIHGPATINPSTHGCNPLLAQPTCIDIGDRPFAIPSSMEMDFPSLMQGFVVGETATSGPSKSCRRKPSFIPSSSKLFRCGLECSYETNKKSDFDRHRKGTKHEAERHDCPFPDCTKSYTRKYTLKKHERTHFRND